MYTLHIRKYSSNMEKVFPQNAPHTSQPGRDSSRPRKLAVNFAARRMDGAYSKDIKNKKKLLDAT